jgi:hypothetical protein
VRRTACARRGGTVDRNDGCDVRAAAANPAPAPPTGEGRLGIGGPDRASAELFAVGLDAALAAATARSRKGGGFRP